MPKSSNAKSYLWCATCRRSYSHGDAPDRLCPVCGGPTREMSRIAAIARGLMANELTTSPLETKHRQLIKLIWTRNGMGEQYYRVLGPDMPYSRFESRMTKLMEQGAAEGWVRFILPLAPTDDEAAYRMEFVDEDRFIQELEALVAPEEKAS
jgi:hypothetical protein